MVNILLSFVIISTYPLTKEKIKWQTIRLSIVEAALTTLTAELAKAKTKLASLTLRLSDG